MREGDGGGGEWQESQEDEMALMLFTSGSTGTPKGVVLTHRNILCRTKGSVLRNDFTNRDVSINWFPFTHIVGLVMLHIHDLFLGCKQIHAGTETILGEPLKWLDLIEQYKATITWAPNFAFGLINEQADEIKQRQWDLSSLRAILNAGEAIVASTTRKFLELLKPSGLPDTAMLPGYGMSETTSCITYNYNFSLDTTSDADAFVGLGGPFPGVSLRIVDGQDELLREGDVGRLQVKGITVTSGYYKNDELNREVLKDGWLATGDLGFLHEGQLTITGREKDVIIINGINYYSHEIEAVVEELDGVEVSYTAACGVRDGASNTDEVAIFFHAQERSGGGVAQLVGEIRQRVGQRVGVSPRYVLEVERAEIPKTAIGKIQRSLLKKKFETGQFDAVLERMDILLENENTLPSWFYKKEWRRESLPLADIRKPGSSCLIFADQEGLGEALVAKLESYGGDHIRVEHGREFAQTSPRRYTINYGDPDHYSRLFSALDADEVRFNEIIHLGNYGAPCEESSSMRVLKAAQADTIFNLLSLVQALAENPLPAARLTVVTNHAVMTAPDEKLVYEKGALSGFLKSVPLELSWLKCCHLDFDDGAVEDHADDILREIGVAQGNSREVAYRQGSRLISYLSQMDMERQTAQEIPLKKGGIYLLTGGLGGVGIHVATWLIKSYDAKLVIVGRTPLPRRPEWEEHLKEDTAMSQRIRNYLTLEATGGEFIYEFGDVGDFSFVNDVVSRVESEWEWGEPLAGIFHLAGTLASEGRPDESHWDVLDEHWIATESRRSFESQLQAKVYGTWVVGQLLNDRPEALLVAFSSVNSFFGGITLGAYAAANSFLESFCLHQRFQQQRNVYCLGWSMWDGIGMTRELPTMMRAASMAGGYEAISVAQGLNSLVLSLRYGQPWLYVGLNSVNKNIRRFLKDVSPEKQSVRVYYSLQGDAEFSEPGFHQRVSKAFARLDTKHRATVKLVRVESFPPEVEVKLGQDEISGLSDGTSATALEAGAPGTETEIELISLWQEVLEKRQVGIDDNFFALGG
ncbi:MAG TPA: AMP-binding protein, partial [Pyrinomonadaceae bacterium]|nr:AMP-binding protein [Pyrinomonadaceae bacterium]